MAEQTLKFVLKANTSALKEIKTALSEVETAVISSNDRMSKQLRNNANYNRAQMVEPLKQAVVEIKALQGQMASGFGSMAQSLGALQGMLGTINTSIATLQQTMTKSSTAVKAGAGTVVTESAKEVKALNEVAKAATESSQAVSQAAARKRSLKGGAVQATGEDDLPGGKSAWLQQVQLNSALMAGRESDRLYRARVANYVSWWKEALAEQEALESASIKRQTQDYVLWWREALKQRDTLEANQQAAQQARQRANLAYLAQYDASLNQRMKAPYGSLGAEDSARTFETLEAQRRALLLSTATRSVSEATREVTTVNTRWGQSLKQTSAELINSQKLYRDFHDTLRGLTGGFGMIWLSWGQIVPLMTGLALASGVREMVSAGTQFDKTVAQIGAASEKLRGNLQNVRQDILDMTRGSGKLVTETADIYKALVKAGWEDQSKLQKAVPVASKMSRLDDMDAATSAEFLTSMAAMFKMGDQIEHIGDVTVKAANMSRTSLLKMAESMKQTSTVGFQYGASIEDAAAATVMLAQVGITGQAAGTAFRNMLIDLSGSRSQKAKALIKEVRDKTGENISVTDDNGQLRDLADVLESVAKVYDQLTPKQQLYINHVIGSERGTKALIAALNQSQGSFREIRQQLIDSSNGLGTMNEAVKELEKSLAEQYNLLKGDLSRVLAQAFDDPKDSLRELVVSMRELAQSQGFADFIGGAASALSLLARSLQFVMQNIDALVAYIGVKAIIGVGKLAAEFWVMQRSTQAAAIGAGTVTSSLMNTVVPGVTKTQVAMGLLGRAFTAVGGWPVLVGVAAAGIVGYFSGINREANALRETLEKTTQEIERLANRGRFALAKSRAQELIEKGKDTLSTVAPQTGPKVADWLGVGGGQGKELAEWVTTQLKQGASAAELPRLIQQQFGSSLPARAQDMLANGLMTPGLRGQLNELKEAQRLIDEGQARFAEISEREVFNAGYEAMENPKTLADPKAGTGNVPIDPDAQKSRTSGRFYTSNEFDELVRLAKNELDLTKERSTLLSQQAQLEEAQFDRNVLNTQQVKLETQLLENQQEAQLKILEYLQQTQALRNQLADSKYKLGNDTTLGGEAKQELQEKIDLLTKQVAEREKGFSGYAGRVAAGTRNADAQAVNEATEKSQQLRMTFAQRTVDLAQQQLTLTTAQRALNKDGLSAYEEQLRTVETLTGEHDQQNVVMREYQKLLDEGGLSEDRRLQVQQTLVEAKQKQLDIETQLADLQQDDRFVTADNLGSKVNYALAKQIKEMTSKSVSMADTIAESIVGGFDTGIRTFVDEIQKGNFKGAFAAAAQSFADVVAQNLNQWAADQLSRTFMEGFAQATGIDLLGAKDVALQANTLATERNTAALLGESMPTGGGSGGGGSASGPFGWLGQLVGDAYNWITGAGEGTDMTGFKAVASTDMTGFATTNAWKASTFATPDLLTQSNQTVDLLTGISSYTEGTSIASQANEATLNKMLNTMTTGQMSPGYVEAAGSNWQNTAASIIGMGLSMWSGFSGASTGSTDMTGFQTPSTPTYTATTPAVSSSVGNMNWQDMNSLGNLSKFGYTFAKGGVMTALGALPLHAYSGGGVALSPQLALFGEGRRPEAYVPLDDGRTIPVRIANAMAEQGVKQEVVQMTITNHFTVQSGTSRETQQQIAASANAAMQRATSRNR